MNFIPAFVSSATTEGGVGGLSLKNAKAGTVNRVTIIVWISKSTMKLCYPRSMSVKSLSVMIANGRTKLTKNPIGTEIEPIAVAMARSLSPNHSDATLL